jgi:hypothetical protein
LLDLLKKIEEDKKAAQEVTQSPASQAEIDALKIQLKSKFGAEIPEALIRFLSLQNGLDYNGVVIYGTLQTPEKRSAGGFWQGLIAANALWREGPTRDYLVIGDTEMDILTVELDGSSPKRRDRVSGDVVEEYASVEDMLVDVLQDRL